MWARCCIDINDRGDVLGFSVEVHYGDTLHAVHVFPNGPFDSPADTARHMVEWLIETYGTQLELALF